MTKYYCDRCGKEVNRLIDVKVPDKREGKTSFSTKNLSVCCDCEREHTKLIDTILDIRFLLFAKYFEKGGEG